MFFFCLKCVKVESQSAHARQRTARAGVPRAGRACPEDARALLSRREREEIAERAWFEEAAELSFGCDEHFPEWRRARSTTFLQTLKQVPSSMLRLQRLLHAVATAAAAAAAAESGGHAAAATAASCGCCGGCGWRLQAVSGILLKLVCGCRLRGSTQSTIKMRGPVASGCK